MGQFLETFKKQGGWNLIKNYWNNRVLIYAFAQLFLLGRSKKALEILRLGVSLKVYRRLRKEFLPLLKKFDSSYDCEKEHVHPSKRVWVYWSTGIENAPEIVKICYNRIKEYLNDREVILLSMSNYSDYVELPNYIIEKYNKGIIKHVHFADLLRAELLAKHGGTWIDSTVYLMDNHFPKYMFDGEFFMFQMLKPGLDGHSGVVSSWFITASANSKLIMAQRYLLRSYWKKYNKAIDYFFFHHFMTLISEYYTDDWKKVIQYPNSAPHILLLMLYEPFQQEKWNAAKELCPIQKLTYKIDKEKATVVKNSYLNFILNSTKIRDLVFSVE